MVDTNRTDVKGNPDFETYGDIPSLSAIRPVAATYTFHSFHLYIYSCCSSCGRSRRYEEETKKYHLNQRGSCRQGFQNQLPHHQLLVENVCSDYWLQQKSKPLRFSHRDRAPTAREHQTRAKAQRLARTAWYKGFPPPSHVRSSRPPPRHRLVCELLGASFLRVF